MDIWVSGAAGRALVRRGDETFLFDRRTPDAACYAAQAEIAHFFFWASDRVYLRLDGSDWKETVLSLMQRFWHVDKALNLVLQGVDGRISKKERELAAYLSSDELLQPDVFGVVRSRLLMWPLPDEGRIHLIEGAHLFNLLVAELDEKRGVVKLASDCWETHGIVVGEQRAWRDELYYSIANAGILSMIHDGVRSGESVMIADALYAPFVNASELSRAKEYIGGWIERFGGEFILNHGTAVESADTVGRSSAREPEVEPIWRPLFSPAEIEKVTRWDLTRWRRVLHRMSHGAIREEEVTRLRHLVESLANRKGWGFVCEWYIDFSDDIANWWPESFKHLQAAMYAVHENSVNPTADAEIWHSMAEAYSRDLSPAELINLARLADDPSRVELVSRALERIWSIRQARATSWQPWSVVGEEPEGYILLAGKEGKDLESADEKRAGSLLLAIETKMTLGSLETAPAGGIWQP